jgi:hypothetical protein
VAAPCRRIRWTSRKFAWKCPTGDDCMNQFRQQFTGKTCMGSKIGLWNFTLVPLRTLKNLPFRIVR